MRDTPTGDHDTSPSDAFLREVAEAPPALPTPDQDLSGSTVGRYQLLHRLGRGAMGIVYAARDPVLHRTVALKLLPSALVDHPDRRRRFLREARSAAAAAHPNIASIYDAEEDQGRVFIAMELVEGRTLRDLIAMAYEGPEPSRLAPHEIARLGQQIALGLARAHEAGVIHRDLKPDNVMITPEGQAKILDFGVAKLREAEADALTTHEGQLVGTPSYMAPEQAKGRPVDERADLFSLGVILYEMATGVRPFTGATTADVLVAIDREEPLAPSRRRPALGADLERVILRCLEKRPEARYASSHALAADLGRIARTSLPDETTAPLAAAGAPRAPRARRRWALGAALGIAAFGVAALFRAAPWPSGAPSFSSNSSNSSSSSSASAPSTSSAAPLTSPLAAPGAALACPPLEATGIEAPTGWLGAAAASIACRRARILMGGAPERVVVPAALLDLPRQPRDDFPPDPFVEPSARARALAAARARGAAYLDGHVSKEARGFRVELVLKDPHDSVLARGEGEGEALYQAVRGAMTPLLGARAIVRAKAVDGEEAIWSGIDDPERLLALEDLGLALGAAVGVRDEEAALAPHKAALGAHWARLQAALSILHGEGWKRIEAPALDRSSAAAFALSAPVYAMLHPESDAAALADEAHQLASRASSDTGRATMALAEAELRARAGDEARARALVLTALSHDPASGAWDTLSGVTYAQPGEGPGQRAHAAWVPESANAWNVLSFSDDHKGDRQRPLELIRRAYLLSPGQPLFAVHMSMMLLALGKREEARAVAAELLATSAAPRPGAAADARLIAGELSLANVEASEGRLGAAMARCERVLFGLPAFGRLDSTEMYIATLLMDLAMVLDRAPLVADRFVETFVDPSPPRLQPGRFVPGRVASVCALGSPVVARRCFDRLKALLAEGFFREAMLPTTERFVSGAEAFARGDYAAAAAAFRPLSQRPGTQGKNLLPEAFDRAGEPDMAERIDAGELSVEVSFNGVNLSHLRAARRAFARGDRARAEALGRRVIEAWSVADVPVPAVAELKAMLGGKPLAATAAKGKGRVD